MGGIAKAVGGPAVPDPSGFVGDLHPVAQAEGQLRPGVQGEPVRCLRQNVGAVGGRRGAGVSGAAQGAGRGLTDGLLAPVRKGPEGGDGVQVRPGQNGRHGAVGHGSSLPILPSRLQGASPARAGAPLSPTA